MGPSWTMAARERDSEAATLWSHGLCLADTQHTNDRTPTPARHCLTVLTRAGHLSAPHPSVSTTVIPIFREMSQLVPGHAACS